MNYCVRISGGVYLRASTMVGDQSASKYASAFHKGSQASLLILTAGLSGCCSPPVSQGTSAVSPIPAETAVKRPQAKNTHHYSQTVRATTLITNGAQGSPLLNSSLVSGVWIRQGTR